MFILFWRSNYSLYCYNVSSERLRPRSPEKSDESDTEIPVIPDLEEEEKDDLTQKIAYAPKYDPQFQLLYEKIYILFVGKQRCRSAAQLPRCMSAARLPRS